MKLKDADDRLAEAQAALKEAEEAQRRARAVTRAVEADKLLKEAQHAVWQLNHDILDRPLPVSLGLTRQITEMRNVLALEYLGAGPRLEALRRLDPERWPEGDAYYYPDDANLHYTVATYIFDTTGFRGGQYEDYDRDEQKEIDAALVALKGRLVEALGEEAAEASIACWRDGRHDT